tara:strand:+ start:3313 stop:3735 length:423 start_codon:yes stop_codon:yes gene_type:complete
MNTKPKGLLLASFINGKTDDEILQEVEQLAQTLTLTNDHIFLFEEIGNEDRKIITYNAHIPKNERIQRSSFFTMRVHRKKQTNTLYTINALNLAIAQDNDGKVDKSFKLDWEKYRETIMLSTNGNLDVRHLKILKIFKIE